MFRLALLCSLVLFSVHDAAAAAGGTSGANVAFRQSAEEGEAATTVPSLGPWLVLAPVDRRGRRPVRTDAVLAKYGMDSIVRGPEVGEEVVGELGDPQVWTAVEADASGAVAAPEGTRLGVAHTTVESDRARVVLARLQGAATMTVDTRSYQGDVYRYGFGAFPVELRTGTNHVFVSGIRGGFSLTLEEPTSRVQVGGWDVTVGDLFHDELGVVPFQLPLLNTTLEDLEVDVHVGTRDEGMVERQFAGTFRLAAAASTQVAMGIAPAGLYPERFRGQTSVDVPVVVTDLDGEELARHVVTLRILSAAEPHVRTYFARMDGSVQKFGMIPSRERELEKRGLIVSLHGAGVDTPAQLGCYPQLDDVMYVVPTNRRPYGFDWQDWGRLNLNETLFPLFGRFQVDRERLYLTGHSMGGHGVWHNAAVDPDLWAAIAPCAGWRSFDTYGGRPDGALAELWRAADRGSDVEAYLSNLVQLPAYIYHGGADETVSVDEARAMAAHYERLGGDHVLHVEEGKGHWFDGEHPGADCVAHPDLLEFLTSRRRASDPRELDFTCVHPALDAHHHWIKVDQLLDYGAPARVRATWSPEEETVTVVTENVRRFTVMNPASQSEVYVLDEGTVLASQGSSRAKMFVRGPSGEFEVAVVEDRNEKRFDRNGPIKMGWSRKFLVVLPTGGKPEEVDAARERFLYDAAVWAYRGNGVMRWMTDREFLEHLRESKVNKFNNVVLYGNSSSNRAYATVVPVGPISVGRGQVKIGDQVHRGDDLAVLFVKRRKDSEAGMVLVNGSTGAKGDRLAPVINHFVSGAGFPDYLIVSSRVLTEGDGGVVAAGWLNHRWLLQD